MTRGRKPDSTAIRRGLSPMQVDSGGRGVAMPPEVEADPMQREIWSWICPPVNTFGEQDVPILRELVMWHAVFRQCEATVALGDGRIDVYDRQAISTMKQASAEIRALSDMLGLSPLARSRIGLMDATTVKTAADTAAMFAAIDEAYGLPAEVVDVEALP